MSLTKIIIAFLVVLLLFAGIVYFQFINASTPKSKVMIKDQTFLTHIAQEPLELQRGLSGRKSLAQDQAMLFLLKTSGDHPFWMKDMKFPLDIIYINDDKIVSITENAPPPETPDDVNLPLYRSTQPADKVLEINAGLSKKYNFKPGDTVKIEIQK